jgi:hypothetical protein
VVIGGGVMNTGVFSDHGKDAKRACGLRFLSAIKVRDNRHGSELAFTCEVMSVAQTIYPGN